MDRVKEKRFKLERRHLRVRRKVEGSAQRPRLCVHRTLKHTYVQVIDDIAGKTVAAASPLDKPFKDAAKNGGNIPAAAVLGKILAERAVAAGVKKVVFDRGGYKYHGRVKALADAARKAGLEF